MSTRSQASVVDSENGTLSRPAWRMLMALQFGGALVLAAVTAVNNAAAGPGGSQQAVLRGFHAAIVVSLVVALLGVAVTAFGAVRRSVPSPAAPTDACLPQQAVACS